MKFINYLVRWISNNLAVPFWMVGHVHLSLNIYEDVHEIIASFGMNIIVAIGFWLDWKDHKKQQNNERRNN
jgi:hypothetical protein